MSKPLAYSYSLLNAFETCPRQCKEVRIDKNFKEPETEYLKWGNHVHKCLEERIGKRVALPENVQYLEPLCQYLESIPGERYVELPMGIDSSFNPVDFFDPKVWFRGKGDLLHIDPCGTSGTIYDYKTGKPVKDSVQLMDMALLTFIHYPKIQKLTASFIFVKFGDIASEQYTRDDIPRLKASLLERSAAIEKAISTNTFYPKPSGLCKRHCVVTTCEYNGRR
jgi:hypothetical protein